MEALRCTVAGCFCRSYCPVKSQLRVCAVCHHGWVIHAMDKIGQRPSGHVTVTSSSMTNGSLEANYLFDVTSLILFGADAVPTRLKILLDRLFVHFDRDLLLQILSAFGWTHEDYTRGYKTRDTGSNRMLDKWTMATDDEQLIIFNQFLRFSETKEIASEWLSTTSSSSSSPEGHSPVIDLKHLLLNGCSSRSTDPNDVTRQLFAGFHPHHPLSPFLPRYPPGLLSPFLSGAGPVASLGPGSVLPYLLCRPPAIVRTISDDQKTRPEAPTPRPVTGAAGPEKVVAAIKVESERSSVSRDTVFHSTDDDEPIDYSTKDDRVVPDVVMATTVVTPSNETSAKSPEVASAAAAGISISQKTQQQQQQRKVGSVKKVSQATPGYGGTLISPNGKKRVLCTACLKTFCDKGALKIHYSAVHLKELHMCTIDGCTMTFSSRRSRNRHSANPNPKLHFGLTGRRRLHNNNNGSNNNSGSNSDNDNDNMLKDSEDATEEGSSSDQMEAMEAGTMSDGEFQMCPRSEESEERSESPPSDDLQGQRSPDEEHRASAAAFFLGLGLNRPKEQRPIRDDDGYDHCNSLPMHLETGEKASSSSSSSAAAAAAAAHRIGSKRKSAMPTKCFPPFPFDEDDHVMDHVVNDDSSQKKRKLANEELKPEVDEDHWMTIGKDMETGHQMTFPPVQGHSSAIIQRNSVVDLSLSSCGRGSSSQSLQLGSEPDSTLHQDPEEKRERRGRSPCAPVEAASPVFQFQRSFHQCRIDGCDARFPSKRSRDRHSSNAGLHRRMLQDNPGNPDGMDSTLASDPVRIQPLLAFEPKMVNGHYGDTQLEMVVRETKEMAGKESSVVQSDDSEDSISSTEAETSTTSPGNALPSPAPSPLPLLPLVKLSGTRLCAANT